MLQEHRKSSHVFKGVRVLLLKEPIIPVVPHLSYESEWKIQRILRDGGIFPVSSGSRPMTMSSLYPCGKPGSTRTRIETVKKLTIISAFIKGIMMELRLRTSNPVEILIYRNKSNSQTSNLIGTKGGSEFETK